MTIEERFWSKVNKTENCWEWNASLDQSGYGKFGVGYRVLGAHRISWILTYGLIKDQLRVLHKCDNPKCVRPEHLFLGTQKENMADCKRKKRFPIGSKRRTAKLSEQDIINIRLNYSPRSPEFGARALARKYGVNPSLISQVLTGRRWRHTGADIGTC